MHRKQKKRDQSEREPLLFPPGLHWDSVEVFRAHSWEYAKHTRAAPPFPSLPRPSLLCPARHSC